MQKYIGIIGIAAIILVAFIASNNKKHINYRLVVTGLTLQILTAIFILKTSIGLYLFKKISILITSLLDISRAGGEFVFGPLVKQDILAKTFGSNYNFIFIFEVIPTIIFICALVSALYYFGILQIIIKMFAWFFNKLLGVSGAEALANSAVAIVGQVESAIIIQPYLPKLTKSEILTIMTGGMACISGSLMAIYANFGINIEYLLAASFMAIPGSFFMSKIFYPEDLKPVTKDTVKIEIKRSEKSLIEAILDGAFAGARISIGIVAMLIAIISFIALIDKALGFINDDLNLKFILGWLFTPLVYLLGVPKEDVFQVAQLLGTKISLNEFIAYVDLSSLTAQHLLSAKSIAIATFILCGFANFGSIAIQVGGLSQMAPDRKSDFAELGFKSMLCGALVSCISGCIIGILL